jgi:hypothetical protein
MLFDLSTQKWTEAFGSEMGWEQWSHDGRYLYFLDYNPGQGFHYRIVRLRLSDGKIENIVDVQNVGRLTNTLPLCQLMSPLLFTLRTTNPLG